MTDRPGLTVAADAVGAVSMILGGPLAAAPRRGARRLELDATSEARARALGAADLGLGVAILAGRSASRRWAAVAARSALHLAFASEYVRSDRARAAAAMCALFAIDAGVASGLRR